MISFAIIGALSLTLIYFVLRYQNAQRELILMRSTAKLSAKKAQSAFVNLMALSNSQQKYLMEKLDSAHTKGLVKQEAFENLQALFSIHTDVVLTCTEKDATVEEALKTLLRKRDKDIAHIKLVISKFPSGIRMSWSKNNVEGFIKACNEITNHLFGAGEPVKEEETESAAS